MRKICVQAGHFGITSGATGAPREQERTIAISARLVELLSKLPGVELAYRDDAIVENDPKVTSTDWDLYLALHCDMDYAGQEGGGFVDWIDPSIDSTPENNAESKRIAEAIEQVYFTESGIRNMPSRRNANTKFYYMWSVLSLDTHCVIIEMGESIDPHDNVILNDTERQAQILLKSIQNAFPDLKPAPVPLPNCDERIAQIEQKCAADIKTINDQKNTLALQLTECQRQSNIYKGEYDKAIAPDGYLAQIALLETQKKEWIGKEQQYVKDYKTLQTRYTNLRKPGMKFLQDAVIRICDKLGVDLT